MRFVYLKYNSVKIKVPPFNLKKNFNVQKLFYLLKTGFEEYVKG